MGVGGRVPPLLGLLTCRRLEEFALNFTRTPSAAITIATGSPRQAKPSIPDAWFTGVGLHPMDRQ